GSLAAKVPADALAGAPTSYGDVPQLGPAHPGDLGRSILSKQREMGAAPVDSASDAAARAAQEAEAERQRLAAEQKAARWSGVMMHEEGATDTPTSPQAAALQKPGPTSPTAPITAADPGGQLGKNVLVGRVNAVDDINPHKLS